MEFVSGYRKQLIRVENPLGVRFYKILLLLFDLSISTGGACRDKIKHSTLKLIIVAVSYVFTISTA